MADLRKIFPVEEDTPKRKILFVGDEGVGKTTFIERYCEYMRDSKGCDFHHGGEFLAFRQFFLYMELMGRRFPLQFLDLPPGTTRESREGQYPIGVQSIVMCFAIDNPTSLHNVWRSWLPEFRRYSPATTRFYLVGLKSDTRMKMLAADRILVAVERGLEVHISHGFNGLYLECSVEGNPKQARNCMDILIGEVAMHAAFQFPVQLA